MFKIFIIAIFILLYFFIPISGSDTQEVYKPTDTLILDSNSSSNNNSAIKIYNHNYLPKNNNRWWITPLLTFIGMLLSAGLVLWQVNRQNKENLKLQKENIADQFKIDAYYKIDKIISEFNDRVSKNGTWGLSLPHILRNYYKRGFKDPIQSHIRERAMDFSKLNNDLNEIIAELLFAIERYIILEPKLDIFKTAFNSAGYDIRHVFSKLFSKLLTHLPFDINKDGRLSQVFPNPPNESQIVKIEEMLNDYRENVHTFASYVMDFQNELQKLLLGNIFKNVVPLRKPIEKKYKVISLQEDEIKKLEKYFNNETPWGISGKKIRNSILDKKNTTK